MTRIHEGIPAAKPSLLRARPKAKRTSWLGNASKRSWCCFSPGEGPPKASKPSRNLQHKPKTHPTPPMPVSSGEGGAAPRIMPVPSFGPVSEARAFPKVEDAIDFRHWR